MYQTDLTLAKDFLYPFIARQAPASGIVWLDHVLAHISQPQPSKAFYLAFGMAARQLGKNHLELSEEDSQKADQLRKGFHLQGWTVLKTSRVLLILSLAHHHSSDYQAILNTLFTTADVNELEAMYASLPLLPFPEEFRSRCAEGIRTNMRNVLEAIVLNNPYPADYLDEEAWNQMVLKAVFNNLSISQIEGFNRRRNAHLARMLSDFAHERWAAGRSLTPEVWRAVSPFVNDALLKDIEKLMANPDPVQQEAAALVCAESEWPGAKLLLQARPDWQAMITNGDLSWQTIAAKVSMLSV